MRHGIGRRRDRGGRGARAEGLRAALGEIERIDRLIDSVLASVQPAAEHVPAQIEPVDVAALADEVLRSIAPLLARHHVDLQARVRLQALADAGRLRQILELLIENAVKYAPPPTTIRLDGRELGRELMARLLGGSRPDHYVAPVQLIERASLQPPDTGRSCAGHRADHGAE